MSTPETSAPANGGERAQAGASVLDVSTALCQHADALEGLADQRQGRGLGSNEAPMEIDGAPMAMDAVSPASGSPQPARRASAVDVMATAQSAGSGGAAAASPVASAAVTQSLTRRHSILLRGHVARGSTSIKRLRLSAFPLYISQNGCMCKFSTYLFFFAHSRVADSPMALARERAVEFVGETLTAALRPPSGLLCLL
jgi:hypothetical protein